jgi:hemerythrin-like domain-containing protein
MMPAGPLMKEHRLIERMIRIMGTKLTEVKQTGKIDALFMDTAVDFIRTYADRCHHGKEEDILFRELAKKKLSAEHKRIMDELINEHVLGRNTVKKLIAARDRYARGDKKALNDMASNMDALVKLYPKHIAKEDKHFFVPCMDYFTDEQRNSMLNEMWEFDKQLIHEKYKNITAELEKGE